MVITLEIHTKVWIFLCGFSLMKEKFSNRVTK
ncbi:hypothetical protein FB479_107270 [Brevibacillus sp. AG162]|nr:hypothetical protein FB479_107270 [Brevibacillus sp. AG162]